MVNGLYVKKTLKNEDHDELTAPQDKPSKKRPATSSEDEPLQKRPSTTQCTSKSYLIIQY